MAKSGVRLNWGGLDKAFLGAVERLADREILMHGIGEMLRSGTVQRFEDEEAPDGTPWKPSLRATPSEDRRTAVRRDARGRRLKGSGRLIKGRAGGKTLTDTAQLRESIDYRVSPAGDEVRVGSNLPYARVHQMGGKAGRGVILPARPYLGISKQDAEDIQEAVTDFIAESFGGGR